MYNLNNHNALLCANLSHLFFNSSVLSPDLLNRFLIKSELFNSLNNSGLFNLSVEFKFKLPLSNSFSKFRNRVHFLLYYLFFELLTGQRPLVEARNVKNNFSSVLKNKRDLKKLQLVNQIDSFVLKTSAFRFYQISVFFSFLIFFLVSYTNPKLSTFSKLIELKLETSETAVSGVIKNLSVLNFFNFVEDLSGSFFEFKFKVLPFNPKKENLRNKSNILAFFNSSYGLFNKKGGANFPNSNLSRKLFNLRKLNNF